MRVVITSTGGAGHFGPLVTFVEAFGDGALVVVPPERADAARALGVGVRIGAAPEAEDLWAQLRDAPAREAAVLVNRELFGRRCTAALLPAVEAAVDAHRPDLVLHEAAEYAGPIAAERRGLPHAQVALSLAEVEWGSLDLAAPVLEPYGIVEAIRASPYLSRFPASLDPSPYPDTRRYREPQAEPQAQDGPPLVYATLGTMTRRFARADAYAALLEAVAGLDARVLLTVGHDGDPAALGTVPANVTVERWVPQAEVLPRAAVVVAHGGSGTTLGALAAGVPLVLVPLFADQPVNARRLADAGAAIVAAPGATELRAAIERVLDDPAHRRAASRIAQEMAGYPAPPAIAGRITSVSESFTPVSRPSSTRTSSSLR